MFCMNVKRVILPHNVPCSSWASQIEILEDPKKMGNFFSNQAIESAMVTVTPDNQIVSTRAKVKFLAEDVKDHVN